MEEKIEIKKQIEKRLLKEVFLVELGLDINAYKDKLIEEINKSVESNRNNNFKTNVKGKMTPWGHFIENEYFVKIIKTVFKKISNMKITPNLSVIVSDAWGIKIEGQEHTKEHAHETAFMSGVIYLSNTNQILNFPELNIDIHPKVGSVVLFSGFLKHGTRNYVFQEPKFAIAFNICDSAFANQPR